MGPSVVYAFAKVQMNESFYARSELDTTKGNNRRCGSGTGVLAAHAVLCIPVAGDTDSWCK
jgi:hypothetical protein